LAEPEAGAPVDADGGRLHRFRTLEPDRAWPEEDRYRPMCCVVAALFALGPRAAILFWWLVEPVRWNQAFDNFLVPFLGFLILPWTTLAYVLVFPGGIDGFDYVWLGLGVAIDLMSWFSGGYSNRNRVTVYRA